MSRNDGELADLVDIIASSVGSLTNPQKLENTFQSVKRVKISAPTIKKYLEYLEEAFMISHAKRYDVKGRKYINTPLKYYFEDVGLRNARLNFRQQEERPLVSSVGDSFKKIILVGGNVKLSRDEQGISTMGLKEFLLNSDSLDL